MVVTSEVEPGAVVQALGSNITTALLSFLAALGVFRAQLSAHRLQVEKDRQHERELTALQLKQMNEKLDSIESRGRVSLEIVANIARAHGVHHRAIGVDALVSLSGEDS